jgi:CMP-N,N'-diacetyllegionaminic acid synthase
MKVLALIPARGGSKGIPGKNIRPIAGKPLIAWTIEAALRSRLGGAVVVSTDAPAIAEVACAAGAQVPFLRPAELASDTSPGIDTVFHALEQMPDFDAVMLLQPTSPLRSTEDIDGCLELAEREALDSIVSVAPCEIHPAWTYAVDDAGRLRPLLPGSTATRRQDLPDAFALNGALYFARRPWLTARRTLLADDTRAYPMPIERSLDIDTPWDWRLAEFLLDRTTP